MPRSGSGRTAVSSGPPACRGQGEAALPGDWLVAMASWLGPPLGCHGLRLVWVPQPVPEARWVDSLEALDASTIEDPGLAADIAEAHASDGGWLLPVDAGATGVLCLYCACLAEQQESVLPESLQQAALAARTTWALARPSMHEDPLGAPGSGVLHGSGVALVDRDGLRHALHQLRNGLNSLLMNAATLTYRADTLPEPLRRFANQLQREGERCGTALEELEQLVARPRLAAGSEAGGNARARSS